MQLRVNYCMGKTMIFMETEGKCIANKFYDVELPSLTKEICFLSNFHNIQGVFCIFHQFTTFHCRIRIFITSNECRHPLWISIRFSFHSIYDFRHFPQTDENRFLNFIHSIQTLFRFACRFQELWKLKETPINGTFTFPDEKQKHQFSVLKNLHKNKRTTTEIFQRHTICWLQHFTDKIRRKEERRVSGWKQNSYATRTLEKQWHWHWYNSLVSWAYITI